MAHHFTRNTVSAEAWCEKEHKRTPHAVSDGRLAHCLTCYDKRQAAHAAQLNEPQPARQVGFDFAGVAS